MRIADGAFAQAGAPSRAPGSGGFREGRAAVLHTHHSNRGRSLATP
jgi:hypothetical protein